MKLSDDARFPHPVVTSEAGDYGNSGISWSLSGTEAKASGKVRLTGRFDVIHPGFESLVGSGHVAAGLQVACLDTYFNRFLPVSLGEFSAEIDAGQLLGLVQVRPVLYAVTEVTLPDERVNAEFGHSSVIFSGDVAGYGDEARFVVGLEKLAPLESIFVLTRNLDLLEPRFEMDTSGQTIRINVSSSLYDDIEAIRGTGAFRNVLLSSLYLPCIIELLSIAANDPYEDLRWYRVITSRCEHLGLRLDGKDLARNAQTLLCNPLGLLRQVVGSIE